MPHGKFTRGLYADANAFDRQLLDSIPLCTQLVYVIRWVSLEGESRIYGVGVAASGTLGKVIYAHQTYILIGCAPGSAALSALANVSYVDSSQAMERIPGIFRTNADSWLYHEIANPMSAAAEQILELYAVPTVSLVAAKRLHWMLNDGGVFQTKIKTCSMWTLEAMIAIRSTPYPIVCAAYPPIAAAGPSHRLPVATFDIETVSHLPNRVPTGNNMSDILFSVSVTTEQRQYTFFHIPRDASAVSKLYPKLQVYECECTMLQAVLQLFASFRGPYILLGYNSKGYDLPFLFARSVYLGLPEVRHFGLNGDVLVYGVNMIHVDLMQVIYKYYQGEFTSFSLKQVSANILKDNPVLRKVDLDAINLRYVYKNILCDGFGSGAWPALGITFAAMVKYNDMDSILVSELWKALRYGEFLPEVCRTQGLSLIRLGQTQVQEYLSTSFLLHCFEEKVLFARFPPVVRDTASGAFDLADLAADGTAAFVGGLNYRDSLGLFSNVRALDYEAYYPFLIAGFNISSETVAIVKGISVTPTSTRRVFKYCSHRGHDELSSALITRQLVQGLADNMVELCPQDPISAVSSTDRLVVIDTSRPGILAGVLAQQNRLRQIVKETRSAIECAIGSAQVCLDERAANDDDEEAEADAEREALVPLELESKPERCHYELLVDVDEYTSESIRHYTRLLQGERSRIHSVYRSMKVLNSSYYGLLGARSGLLAAAHVAAIVTMLGRRYIIEAARQGALHGFRTVLMDTDSVFLEPPAAGGGSIEAVVTAMRDQHESLVLGVKLYSTVLVMKKKVYLAQCGNKIFSRGINRTGPALWNRVLFDSFSRYLVRREPVGGVAGVIAALEEIFRETYTQLRQEKSVILCTLVRKEADEYKSKTPMKRLLDRLHEENPGYVAAKKVQYFHLFTKAVTCTEFEIDYKLEQTPLRLLNLAKFYNKIQKPLHCILNVALLLHAEARHVSLMLSEADFNKMYHQAFANVLVELAGG